MRYIAYSLLLMVLTTSLCGQVTIEEASKIPSVQAYDKSTAGKAKKHLNQAVSNTHWQNAVAKLRTSDREYSLGKNKIPTFDLIGALDEFYAASNDGVLIAPYQGYVITMQTTLKQGAIARKYIPFFAAQMMKNNLCEGYYEFAYVYANGWVEKKQDYKKAIMILNRGKEACQAPGIPQWQKHYWEMYTAQYSALLKEQEQKSK